MIYSSLQSEISDIYWIPSQYRLTQHQFGFSQIKPFGFGFPCVFFILPHQTGNVTSVWWKSRLCFLTCSTRSPYIPLAEIIGLGRVLQSAVKEQKRGRRVKRFTCVSPGFSSGIPLDSLALIHLQNDKKLFNTLYVCAPACVLKTWKAADKRMSVHCVLMCGCLNKRVWEDSCISISVSEAPTLRKSMLRHLVRDTPEVNCIGRGWETD